MFLGSMLHAGKEAWYISGLTSTDAGIVDTGAYSLDAALGAVKDYADLRRHEFADDNAYQWAITAVSSWLEAAHRYYGPGGHTPIWPEQQVLCFDDGTPAIEREFTVPLDYKDYIFTSRIDAITLWQDRYLTVVETKSAAPSWVERYVAQLPKSAQFTGELFVVRHHPDLRDLPWDKLQVAYHLKGWRSPAQGGNSIFATPVIFGSTSRTPEQLERFRLRVIEVLREIDEAVTSWDLSRKDAAARDRLFPETGEHTGCCYSFNSECEFMGPCLMGFAPTTIGGYRSARAPDEPMSPLDTDVDAVA
jgi:hypothetical protein